MGSDVGGEWASSYKQGHNFFISINAATKGEADKLFDRLSNDGEVKMPMNKTFWAIILACLQINLALPGW